MQPWPFPSQQKLNGVPNTDIMYSYYDFLEAASFSHIPSEDFKFLEYKGCFHLPNRQILDKFVEGYFKYVHPALPLLDEGQFWDMYDDSGQRPRQAKKISLFLFRCMMFASASVGTSSLVFPRLLTARSSYQLMALLPSAIVQHYMHEMYCIRGRKCCSTLILCRITSVSPREHCC